MTTPGPGLRVSFAEELHLFLTARHRRADALHVPHDETSTLGHVIQSLGVPLTEVGELVVDGHRAAPSYRPRDGESAHVPAVQRPQLLPSSEPPHFVLDVHLGALARRLRLVGLDTAYGNDMSDDALLRQANAERGVLLTQDRGLLQRGSLWLGAYVRGAHPDAQLLDVLDRFAPSLSPWTRCLACNGALSPVAKSDIATLLRPGTRRTYDTFMRCDSCARLYWRGAHSAKLEATVRAARTAVRERTLS
ncbi:MAG: Mut7-C RNAse domain-containing protein [Streptomyces sp.]|uniref:Mut7-C RNAse domain-containing protein n=1 Tax=Streptomyces sp. TaxID=1931 RepID=UPI003D6C4073